MGSTTCLPDNMSHLVWIMAVSLLGSILAQKEPRLGQDGRPLLNKPILDLCRDRKYHEKYGKHHYFLSWREPWNKFEDWDWFNGRNFCRERCMDLASFETADEYRHFAKIMYRDNITAMWTSGRKCNFLNKGCDAAALQPVNVNGWFWADGKKRIPSTNTPSKQTFWSNKGEGGQRQPDNFEGKKAGTLQNVRDDSGMTVEGLQEWYDEACLVVYNNKYNDGVQWHDVPCFTRARIICEDSELQMERIKSESGVDVTVPLSDA